MARRGRGEGSIHQRSDGRWVGVVSLGYRNGRRHRKYVYARTRAEVVKKMAAVIKASQDGLPIPSDKQTVAQFLDRWLRDVIEPSNRKETTKASYADNVRLHLKPAFGRVRVMALSPQHILDFIRLKREQGYSDRTIQYCCAILRAALNQALAWGEVHRNAVALVRLPAPRSAARADLDAQSQRRLLMAAKESRYFSLFLVIATLGLRRGEALALHWQDVDLDAGTANIVQSLQRVPRKGLLFSTPKNPSSRHVVELPSQIVDLLREHRLRQLQERLAAGSRWTENDLVFPSTVGTPVEPRNVNRHFKTICNKAGFGDQTIHDLRHAAASIAYAAGLDTKAIQEVLRHSRHQTTVDLYVHLERGTHREATQKIADALLGDEGTSSA
jgi:integrase